MEAVELGLREALFKDGRCLLEKLYNQSGLNVPDNTSRPRGKMPSPSVQGHSNALWRDGRAPELFLRARNEHRTLSAGSGAGVGAHSFSPGLVRLAARGGGSRRATSPASEDLLAQAGVDLEGRQIQRLVNLIAPGVGRLNWNRTRTPPPIPFPSCMPRWMAPASRWWRGGTGRTTWQAGGWISQDAREVKLGAIFAQTKTDEDGLPVRDHALSTTYVGSFECAQDFGSIRAEGRRRGLGRSIPKWVFIGDGAASDLGTGAGFHFPAAMFILDLYHALERLNEASARDSTGEDNPGWSGWHRLWTAMLKTTRFRRGHRGHAPSAQRPWVRTPRHTAGKADRLF